MVSITPYSHTVYTRAIYFFDARSRYASHYTQWFTWVLGISHWNHWRGECCYCMNCISTSSSFICQHVQTSHRHSYSYCYYSKSIVLFVFVIAGKCTVTLGVRTFGASHCEAMHSWNTEAILSIDHTAMKQICMLNMCTIYR